MIDRLFFYGTLMSGQHVRSATLAHRGLALPVGPAQIQGELYAVGMGAFPALMRTGGDRAVVHGELWEPIGATRAERVRSLLEAFRVCDAIEGYRPGDEANSMYVREAVELVDQPGVKAWTYIWNERDTFLGPRIPSGSWRQYVGRPAVTA